MNRNIWTIIKRELSAYFTSPVAYVIIVIFLVLSGACTFWVSRWLEARQANLGAFFMWHPWLYLFLVPAVGMRLWSEERRLGTLELLMTLPVTPWQAIIGKFLASWAVLGIALGLTFPMVITVNHLGDPDNGVIFGSYCGSFLMAGAYLAISCLTSAMTRNQGISFILSVVACLLLVLAGWPMVTDVLRSVSWLPGWSIDIAVASSIMYHFEDIQRGVIDFRNLFYFLSLITFSLFATGVTLRSLRA